MNSQVLASAVALIAPPRCATCSERCLPDEWLCGCCSRKIRALPKPLGRPGITGAFEYGALPRELVAQLKFGGAVALAAELAGLMLERDDGSLANAGWIVPAPSHPARLRQRGYNPARMLAARVAQATGARLLDCLVRRGGRPPQSELGRRERLALPSGAISLNEPALRRAGLAALEPLPTNLIVCDDVATTGVTLEACTQAIRNRMPGADHRSLRAAVFALA